jgi:hypothetical protein
VQFGKAGQWLDLQIAELRAMLDGRRPEPAATPEAAPPKRKISAAARRRMGLGQQKRWAAIKGTTESPSHATTLEPSKPKRKLSAAGRAAIVAALKRRWREKKAAAVKVASAVTKKATAKKAAAKKTTTKKAAKGECPVDRRSSDSQAPSLIGSEQFSLPRKGESRHEETIPN